MRLKLVLICSLIAAAVGVGSSTAIILLVLTSLKPVTGWLALLTYLIPLLAILVAAIFVYRHTARRRRLQAALTAIISLLLTFCMFLLLSILSAPRLQPTSPPAEPPRNVG